MRKLYLAKNTKEWQCCNSSTSRGDLMTGLYLVTFGLAAVCLAKGLFIVGGLLILSPFFIEAIKRND